MSDPDPLLPFRPRPDPRRRPWGGRRFASPEGGEPYGELWVAGPGSRVEAPGGGEPATLNALTANLGGALVGEAGMALYGPRFPLLVKLIDPADWLSLQVHPDDSQAGAFAGSAAAGTLPPLGKLEAWYVIDAAPGAQLVIGPRAGADRGALRAALARGDVPREMLETIPTVPGSIVHIPPRTLHAIGPGSFLYEVQQPSDLTLRASDWGRPATPGRQIHATEALHVVDFDRHAEVRGPAQGAATATLTTDRFRLEVLRSATERRPAGRTLEVVTPVVGSVVAEGDGWREALATFDTLVVPASVASYRLEPSARSTVCLAALP